MKDKWQIGKTYVYYIPEVNEIYTAEVITLSPSQNLRHYSLRGHGITHFNPDVVIVIREASPIFKKYETVFLGEL